MLTGLWPPEHGVRDNAEYRLSPDADTLTERLSDAGYDTAAFVSAFVLESRYGLDQGFDLYEDRDFGPLLRGEGFEAFRAKHPPPE